MQVAPQHLTQPSGSSTASGQQHEQAEDKSQTLVTDTLDQHSESCMGTFAHLDSQLQAHSAKRASSNTSTAMALLQAPPGGMTTKRQPSTCLHCSDDPHSNAPAAPKNQRHSDTYRRPTAQPTPACMPAAVTRGSSRCQMLSRQPHRRSREAQRQAVFTHQCVDVMLHSL